MSASAGRGATCLAFVHAALLEASPAWLSASA
jgi:hypothetical protein